MTTSGIQDGHSGLQMPEWLDSSTSSGPGQYAHLCLDQHSGLWLSCPIRFADLIYNRFQKKRKTAVFRKSY